MSRLHRISGCDDPGRKADIVFIHGLGGDAFGTWRHGQDDAASWPHWLAEELPEAGVWSLGYPASPTKWIRVLGWFSKRRRDAGYSMALPDRALQVLDLMVQEGLGQRPILFICHSLGGLVAKQVLRKADDAGGNAEAGKKQIADRTRAILFLATPHAGASLASLLHAFRAVFGATVGIEDLRAHDAHLRDLYDWYRKRSAYLGIETVTYYELRGIGGVLPIVNPTSAHPGAGADPVGFDEDHISIAKPRDRGAQVYGAARKLLRDSVLAPRVTTPTEPQSPLAAPVQPPQVIVHLEQGSLVSGNPRVPCELPPAAERHFGRRTELLRITERQSLALRRRLTEADPSNAGWQRDLSFSLTQMAQLHELRGNRTEALPLAEESLTIDERLAVLDRSNVTWQGDVAVSRALVDRLRNQGG